MNNIFVTGHRNPDTDSIVAAMAYANLRNALGDREYKAVRIGSISDETQQMLDYFGFEPPMYVHNMRMQVSDLDFDHFPEFNYSVSLDLVWRAMRDGNISTMPILKDDGTLYGTISAGDIARHDMNTIYDSHVDDLPLFNLLSVLEGRLVNEFSATTDHVSGDVVVALPAAYELAESLKQDSIVICGNQPELIERLLEKNINCIILCQSDVPKALSESHSSSCIISTPLDPRQVARLIYQAIPVFRVCSTENIICFHLDDYVDDVREHLTNSRYRCYPVLDENNKVVGTLSRFHLLRPRAKKVVLVDHNEASQSVPGLDQVEILEIIDHHRLADIQTRQPICVRNEPVGSTNTIITAMYQEYGVVPSPAMAGLMAAAILSDTVMFKSPTCTKRDIAMAERLARIANVSLEELGTKLFSSTNGEKSAEELFKTDYKTFHIAEKDFGVSQITCVDASVFLNRKEEFLATMETIKKHQELDFIMLMLTDILAEGSHLLYVGSDEIMRQAFNEEPKDKYLFIPGMLSRKKQLIPTLTVLWG